MSYRNAARVMADDCLCFRARRVSRALTRLYDDALRPLEIQATQLTVLNAVALLEERDAPMGELADLLAMDLTTLSRNLGPLRRVGLVRIDRSGADGRVRLARLTDEGRHMLDRALPLWEKAHQTVVKLLGPELADGLREDFDAAVEAAVTASASTD